MTTQRQLLTAVIAVLAAALISFVLTPVVKALAPKFGFVDVPKDERRMHNHPIPTIGGLAIFVSFVLVSLFVCHLNRQFIGMLLGALVIVVWELYSLRLPFFRFSVWEVFRYLPPKPAGRLMTKYIPVLVLPPNGSGASMPV